MADNRNDKELDLGKLPVFELRIPADMEFVFGVDSVHPYGEHTILAGQVFRGEIVPGAIVSYGEIGPKHVPVESFACYISSVQAPNEEKQTMEPVERVSKDSAMGGRCALVVTGREAKHFKECGIVFARRMEM